MAAESTKSLTLKQRAEREVEEYLVVAVFLFALLGALTVYRRLLMSEAGLPVLHYGYAAIEALVLAKVIWIGQALHVGERYHEKSLILSALYEALVFGVLALVAHALEHVIHALVTGESLMTALARPAGQLGEIVAYMLVVVIAMFPFFSLQQAGRLLGEERFLNVLLKRPTGRTPA